MKHFNQHVAKPKHKISNPGVINPNFTFPCLDTEKSPSQDWRFIKSKAETYSEILIHWCYVVTKICGISMMFEVLESINDMKAL